MNKYPLTTSAILLVLLSATYIELGEQMALLFMLVCGLVLMMQPKLKTLLIVVFIMGFGYLRLVDYLTLKPNSISNYLDQETELIAVVVNTPYESNDSKIVILAPEQILVENKWVNLGSGMVRSKFSRFEQINKGDRVLLKLGLKQPVQFSEFDYIRYLKTIEVYAIGDRPVIIERLGSKLNVLERLAASIRHNLTRTIRSNLPEPHASLVTGMLIGSKEDFPGVFDKQLSVTGTTHIIAVSGYNVSMVAMLVLSLSGRLPRRLLLISSLVALFMFVLLVGSDNLPALRAGIMGSTVIIGMLTGRKSAVFTTMAIALILMVISNPFVYASLSFQLSFVSTLGLIFISDGIKNRLPSMFGETIRSELSVTLSAIIATFPIVFGNFNKLTIYAPVANLLVGPLVPLIMATGALGALVLSLLPAAVKTVVIFCCWLPVEILVKVVSIVSSLPFSEMVINQNSTLISQLVLVGIFVYIFENNFLKYETRNCN